MRRLFTLLVTLTTLSLATNATLAVELLVSGDFETPQGFDLPGWELQQFITGSGAATNSAGVVPGPLEGEQQLFLMPFNGGGPLGDAEGNFDGDVPNDVDGNDFLTWQRGNSPTPGSSADLATWQSNYGRKAQLTNAVLEQTVAVSAGETYTFSGTSMFEDNFSGLLTTLDAEGPFGAIPSPTTTAFKMEFLDSGGAVVGSPTTLDLRADFVAQSWFPGTPLDHTPLTAQAPVGAVNVRLTAEAKDMAWNGNAITEGNIQSAFYDNFSLTAASASGTELLTNPSLDDDPPNALDFWTLSTDPVGCCGNQLLRTPIAGFANNTPGGTRGVWISPFFGAHAIFEANPVDATMSQTVDIVPGGTYTFSGSTKFEGNYSGGVDTIASGDPDVLFAGLPSPTKTEIELAFLDINGIVIGTPALIDVKTDRESLLGCTGTEGCANSNTWLDHTLVAEAPANAVQARLTGRMIDGVFNVDPQQSAFFDDFSLEGPAPLSAASAVPEPASVVSLALGGLLLGLCRSRRRS